MDPPTELPLNGTHEELAPGKINWLPAEERREKKKRGDGKMSCTRGNNTRSRQETAKQ